jgi:hypothetical protein
MSKKLALVSVSVPGDIPEDSRLTEQPAIAWLESVLEKNNIKSHVVDTVMGWGNLNQDWLEFRAEIETSWSWCELCCLSAEESETFRSYLSDGKLLMRIYYIKNEEGKETFIPHY